MARLRFTTVIASTACFWKAAGMQVSRASKTRRRFRGQRTRLRRWTGAVVKVFPNPTRRITDYTLGASSLLWGYKVERGLANASDVLRFPPIEAASMREYRVRCSRTRARRPAWFTVHHESPFPLFAVVARAARPAMHVSSHLHAMTCRELIVNQHVRYQSSARAKLAGQKPAIDSTSRVLGARSASLLTIILL
ncbi:hypothetical protein K505DRAFT_111323 [Melanomma pulvis-pyrius CBS 109.77]|uniref:Uncharacterized protein n=1 Tax=Melanomma pulvis-pyrius CBS 109.77 TaxID=1314802 RepID=A0A6A6WVS6_9PLEO|nr:hypothetical protein K505DRAFT_111323 [Melanomma pulvis-pyrius CBS 109.77]